MSQERVTSVAVTDQSKADAMAPSGAKSSRAGSNATVEVSMLRAACVSVVVVVVASGCAVRKPAVQPVLQQPAPPAVDVSGLLRRGCYRCLERALAAADGEQAFEVAALLTLRAKELGLPYEDFRQRAGAAAPAEPAFSAYLDAIDTIRPDPLAGAQYRQADGTPRPRVPPASITDRATAWRDTLRTGPGSDLFRRYLDLSIRCTLLQGARDADPDFTVTDADPPLLRYRVGTCGRQPEQFRALRDADPDFVDADLTLARYAANGRPADLDEALRWIRSARDAFPTSPAIATAVGQVYDAREEWSEALAAYEAALTLLPEHRDALLGRTVALSHLKRHDEAIASASHIIDLGSWFLGEAHYWRAWNEFSLQQYETARIDTDRAKTLMLNAAVFTLSGLVEWNLRRLPRAESEFEEALKMDFGRCDAAQYLGRVRVQRNEVPPAVAAFKQAIQCYDLSITVRQKLIADILAGPGSDASKTRAAAAHQRAIDAATTDRDACKESVATLEKRGTQ